MDEEEEEEEDSEAAPDDEEGEGDGDEGEEEGEQGETLTSTPAPVWQQLRAFCADISEPGPLLRLSWSALLHWERINRSGQLGSGRPSAAIT